MNKILLIFNIFGIALSDSVRSCFPCRCDVDFQNDGFDVVCSDLNLTSVPLTLPRETTTLRLDGNFLKELPKKAFFSLKRLRHLDLSRNLLRHINARVFEGLVRLETLNLDLNQILSVCDYVFAPKFLLPLKSLLKLSILDQFRPCFLTLLEYNYYGYTFPHSLRELYIDCWACNFSSTFKCLTNLTVLSLAGRHPGAHCFIAEITESTFKPFPYLETLNISECQTNKIYQNAFAYQKKLKILDMSAYIFDGAFDAFQNASMSLQDSPIEILKFKYVKSADLDDSFFKYLTNTSLREFYCDSELYTLVSPGTFRLLPQTLEILSFRHFQFYNFEAFRNLRNFPLLWKMDFSGMVLDNKYTCKTYLIVPSSVTAFICQDCMCPYFFGDDSHPYIVPVADFHLLWLQKLDLKGTLLKRINTTIFPENNRMSHLHLSNNRLAKYLEKSNSDSFSRLSKLTFLDLSDNGISYLPPNIFQFANYIKVINISNNHIERLDVILNNLVNLEIIDFSGNKLHELTEKTRNDIDKLPNVSVLLGRNPLLCACDELDFLRWVQINPHRIRDLSSISCRLSTGGIATLNNIGPTVSKLDKLCKSNVVEISVTVCVVMCAVAAVMGYLGYRNRWKLRYLYYVGRRGYRRRHNVIDNNDNVCHYDAFVSYADEDRRFVIDAMIPELEGKCGLKLCIHHRDFLPGEVIAANIVNAIQNSRKTLILLSPSFLKSNWCEFEYNMARMEGVSRREEIVLVVLYEDVPMKALPKDMAMMLRRNCYIEYNNDIFDDEVFWYNVLESIKIRRPTD